MEFLQTVILVVLIYLTAIFVISCVRAIFSLRKGREKAKMVFKDVFWDFFTELLNPFNWL